MRRSIKVKFAKEVQEFTSRSYRTYWVSGSCGKMTRPKVLRLGAVDQSVSTEYTNHIYVTNADHTSYSAKKEFDALSEIADLVVPKSTSRKEFMEECKSGAFDGVVAAYRTFDSVIISGRIDSELVENLPRSLKFIAHNGASSVLANAVYVNS